MDTRSLAYPAHPSTPEDHPHACYEGLVFVGHLVEDEAGEETEVLEAVACTRCKLH